MEFKKTYRPYGILLVTAEIDGKPVTKRFSAGVSDTEIEKAFALNAEPKKGTKK